MTQFLKKKMTSINQTCCKFIKTRESRPRYEYTLYNDIVIMDGYSMIFTL